MQNSVRFRQLFLKIPYNGKFSRRQIYAEFRGQYQSAKIKIREMFPIFDKLVLRNSWRLWLEFAVVTSLKSVFTCGKTSDMQLCQNNLSLQVIWLEVN